MSNPEVQRVIGRAFIDEEFRKQCFTNCDNICDSMNISDDAERKQAAEFLKRIVSFYGSQRRDMPIQQQQQQQETAIDVGDIQDRKKIELNLMKQEVNIAMDVQRYAVDVLKTTVESALISYHYLSVVQARMFRKHYLIFFRQRSYS